MDYNEIRRLANELEIEDDGDLCRIYAYACNHSIGSNPDERLLALKHELEHRMTLLYMEEYFWEQTDTGYWYKVEHDEFWVRFSAAMDKCNKE